MFGGIALRVRQFPTAGDPPAGLDSPLFLELPRPGGDDALFEGWKWIIPRSIALVLKYAPELDNRIRPHLNRTNDSWRVDETYIKVKGVWKYLYRAVNSEGNTLDFMMSALVEW